MPVPGPADLYLPPEDLVDLVRRLRKFASDFDIHSYLISRSFERFGLEAESAATAARTTTQNAANSLFRLLEVLEKTPDYKRQRKEPT